MRGLLRHAAYLPQARLQREEISSVLGLASLRGSRSVASYDEDATTLAVEAGRLTLRGSDIQPTRVYFATSVPPYLDKTNASVVHAALGLDRSALAVDMGGAPRSAVGAVLAGADASVETLVLLSDLRTGLPGSSDEREGGDAAAALLFGAGTAQTPVLATIVASASTTDEFLERWRLPGDRASRIWEERFSEHVYSRLADEAFAAALKAADLTPAQVDHLVVAGLAGRSVQQFRKSSGVRPEAIAPDHSSVIGNSGAAQVGLLLSDVLDRANPEETIVLVHLGDGATAIVLRTTADVEGGRSPRPLAAQLAGTDVPYASFLSWRGMLDREPPRRPEPDAPAAPPTHRSSGYKYGFHGLVCGACDAVTVPPARVCYACGEVDSMAPIPLRDVPGTVATLTVDRLAYTPSPPMIAVVVDFDGGGRFRCELADASPDDVAIGSRVEMTFRCTGSSHGVHNYFWKARPLRTRLED